MEQGRAQCIAILGPTCSWKSSTATVIAKRLQAEIIGCDSMQVYRDMPIGTAAPPLDQQRAVQHHLVGCLPITEAYDASRYVVDANKVLKTLEYQGKKAVLCGGTGLYAKSLIYEFSMFPADEDLARHLAERSGSESGRAALRNELRQSCDPQAIPRQVTLNPRRLARAVEILRLTGKPPWEHTRQNQTARAEFQQVVLLPDMAVLRPRIAQRTRHMLRQGWIEETRALLDMGLENTPTARQALGYRDITAYLRGNIPSVESLEDTLIRRTVRFARRQLTWFRNQHPGAMAVTITRPTHAENLADAILQQLRPQQPATRTPGNILICS